MWSPSKTTEPRTARVCPLTEELLQPASCVLYRASVLYHRLSKLVGGLQCLGRVEPRAKAFRVLIRHCMGCSQRWRQGPVWKAKREALATLYQVRGIARGHLCDPQENGLQGQLLPKHVTLKIQSQRSSSPGREGTSRRWVQSVHPEVGSGMELPYCAQLDPHPSTRSRTGQQSSCSGSQGCDPCFREVNVRIGQCSGHRPGRPWVCTALRVPGQEDM